MAKKWEYKIHWFCSDYKLSQMGQEGWELCSSCRKEYIFKREVNYGSKN